jgi:hypothetical protein
VITDEQRDFIGRLTPEQFHSLDRRMRLYATKELRRRGLATSIDTPRDVVGTAIERLMSDANCPWNDSEPTLEGLIQFLSRRVEDVVKKLRRRMNRTGDVKEFDSRTDMRVNGLAELDLDANISLEELGDAWLNLASASGEDTARVALEYLTGNSSAEGQAEALGLTLNAVYRLRSQAIESLRIVLYQRETNQ